MTTTPPTGPVPPSAVPPPPFAPPPQGYAVPLGPPPPYPGGYPQPPHRPPPPLPIAPGGQRLAEFGDRLLAYLIDRLILGAVALVLILPIYLLGFFWILGRFGFTLDEGRLADSTGVTGDVFGLILWTFALAAVVMVISFGLAYVYEVEMMFRTGQTVGKRVMKLRVIPVDPGLTLTRRLAVRRYLVQYVGGGLIPALSWVDGLWQLWDQPYRQCLHDKFATTLVIKLDA